MATHTIRTYPLRRLHKIAFAVGSALLVAACSPAQDDMGGMEMDGTATEETQEYDFSGTVQGIDTERRIVSVANDEIPGWMMAMTMNYYVEPAQVLDSLAVGDRITATVYSGDFQNLYGVEVVQDP